MRAQGQLCVHQSPHWLQGWCLWVCSCAVESGAVMATFAYVCCGRHDDWCLLLNVTCSCFLETDSRRSSDPPGLTCGCCCCPLDCSGASLGLTESKDCCKEHPLHHFLLLCSFVCGRLTVPLSFKGHPCRHTPACSLCVAKPVAKHSSHNNPRNPKPVHTPPRTASAHKHRTQTTRNAQTGHTTQDWRHTACCRDWCRLAW